jgi:hypothetical protein
MDPFKHLVGLLGWGISPAPRPLTTQDNTIQRNTNTHTSMPRAGFEPAIPMFERPKTVLDAAKFPWGSGVSFDRVWWYLRHSYLHQLTVWKGNLWMWHSCYKNRLSFKPWVRYIWWTSSPITRGDSSTSIRTPRLSCPLRLELNYQADIPKAY